MDLAGDGCGYTAASVHTNTKASNETKAASYITSNASHLPLSHETPCPEAECSFRNLRRNQFRDDVFMDCIAHPTRAIIPSLLLSPFAQLTGNTSIISSNDSGSSPPEMPLPPALCATNTTATTPFLDISAHSASLELGA